MWESPIRNSYSDILPNYLLIYTVDFDDPLEAELLNIIGWRLRFTSCSLFGFVIETGGLQLQMDCGKRFASPDGATGADVGSL